MLILSKALRLDDLTGKPRLRDILSMTIHHKFGGFISIITVKYERRWLESLRKFRHTKALVIHRAGLYKAKLLGRL